jgi:hypothetical protein
MRPSSPLWRPSPRFRARRDRSSPRQPTGGTRAGAQRTPAPTRCWARSIRIRPSPSRTSIRPLLASSSRPRRRNGGSICSRRSPSIRIRRSRLQYVDPANDQAFSPYFAIVPRWTFLPSFSDQTEARQDFNLGFNKRFNFDGSLQPVPVGGDTSASTVWSFGLTAFAQRRLREPQLSSSAVFLIPSVSAIISKDWNASFAIEFLGRWFERNLAGESRRGRSQSRHSST